jgi:serine/threonine-protein kinase
MGEVWRARHRLLARPAAIKLIRPNPAAAGNPKALQDMVRRFRCEAEVIAGLRSPHTVTLFDFGVSTDGDLYYVMELLEGLDADALVRRFGPQPPDRVVRLLCQVCHSLSEAESRGVVHRDIKPANIFLCRYGEDRDFVKVLDFGLAKVLDNAPAGTPDDDDGNIREEPVCGTPAYMAPEQAKGDTALDIRADIYALGCVAYWLLTGSTVFSAGNAAGQLIAQRTEAPVPPSQRTRTPIPPDLERLVMDCLEKDPEQRPQTVGELRTRLDPCDTGTWTEENARDWWGRVPTEPAPAATAGVPQPDDTTRTVLPDLPTA